MQAETKSPMTMVPEYAYHLLRAALNLFTKIPGELDADESARARQQADKTFDIETLVLSSGEAADVIIGDAQVDADLGEIAGRYPSGEDLIRDLEDNNLDEAALRRALHRELRFDAVMRKIGARHAKVNDIDVRLYYEMNKERFELPQKREARRNQRACQGGLRPLIVDRLGQREQRVCLAERPFGSGSVSSSSQQRRILP